MTWFVQLAAGCISKYLVGEDGKTSYEQLKGKPISRLAVEFGEKIHFKQSAKGQKEHKLHAKKNERHFLSSIVGIKDGVQRAVTIRKVGAHRRWDAAGLDTIRGLLWKRDPDATTLSTRSWCLKESAFVGLMLDSSSRFIPHAIEEALRVAWVAGQFSVVGPFGRIYKHVVGECESI